MRSSKHTAHVESVVDDDHTQVSVDIALPGVDAKHLRVRIQNDRLQVRAVAGDVEYRAEHRFCCKVDPHAVRTTLSDGVLHVEAPFTAPFYPARDVRVGGRVERSREPLNLGVPLAVEIDRLRL